MWRSGWPDFLVKHPTLGFIGVEVKSWSDKIRATQAAMFADLEEAGIKVFVWHPSTPERLIPWRKFLAKRGMAQPDGLPRSTQ